MNYRCLRPLLFSMAPELAHRFSLRGLQCLTGLGWQQTLPENPRQVMGINFANPIGIAAGLDKGGEFIDVLGALGVGFIEVGSVSPAFRAGNPTPRMFRLPAQSAIINRIGLANPGVSVVVDRLKQRRFTGVVGVNLAKNENTLPENAIEDYLASFPVVYPHVDYVTINLSCPHEAGLTQLQFGDQLTSLLTQLKSAQKALADEHQREVPLLVKISPDLNSGDIPLLAEQLVAHGIEGVVATNTTQSREAVQGLLHANERGGLSGAPLLPRSLAVVSQIAEQLQGRVAIIGVGGINSAEAAKSFLSAGADLLQLYTGLVYHGPRLLKEIAAGL